MREIKFRAWNKEKQKIITWESMQGWRIDAIRNENIMQYTGLKDKNGKEIYEGDIVNSENYGKGIVDFKNGALGVGGMSFGEHEGEHSNYRKNWKIIGNIYENKELLK